MSYIETNDMKKHKKRINKRKKGSDCILFVGWYDDLTSSFLNITAPLNLDRQCGVLIPPTNEPCTRAITCKIHSVGAKRAVAGRSQSFNDLIAVYQKKGIGRPQGMITI